MFRQWIIGIGDEEAEPAIDWQWVKTMFASFIPTNLSYERMALMIARNPMKD